MLNPNESASIEAPEVANLAAALGSVKRNEPQRRNASRRDRRNTR